MSHVVAANSPRPNDPTKSVTRTASGFDGRRRTPVWCVSERPLGPPGSGGLSLSGTRLGCHPTCLSRALAGATIRRRTRCELESSAPAASGRPSLSSRAMRTGRSDMKKRVVQAGEFEVVDDDGRVRVRIGLSNDEDPFFSLLSPDGQVRMRFGLSADGAAGPRGRRRERQGARDGRALERRQREPRLRRQERPHPGEVRAGARGVAHDGHAGHRRRALAGVLARRAGVADARVSTITPARSGFGWDSPPRARPCCGCSIATVSCGRSSGLAGDGSPFVQFLDEAKQPTWTMR